MDSAQQHKDLTNWQHFKNGDKLAYANIYRDYFQLLFDYGVKIAHCEALTKDCIQNLFVKLWRNRKNLGDPASVKQYLLKSLRRIIVREISPGKVDHYSSDNISEVFNFEIVISKETELINNQQKAEIKAELENAINYLTKRQKEAVYLKFYYKMDYNEIAEVMGVDKNSVYNLIAKSIDILRKNVNKINLSLFLITSLIISF